MREGPPGSHWPTPSRCPQASPATVLVHRLAARPPRSLPPRQHPGMAARRTSLPEELSPGAFTVARAHQLCVTRGRLRSRCRRGRSRRGRLIALWRGCLGSDRYRTECSKRESERIAHVDLLLVEDVRFRIMHSRKYANTDLPVQQRKPALFTPATQNASVGFSQCVQKLDVFLSSQSSVVSSQFVRLTTDD